MRKPTQIASVLALVVVAVVVVVSATRGCNSDGGPDEDPPKAALRVGYLPSLAGAQLYVAIDQGFFDDANIEVKIVEVHSGPEIIQALQSRSIDVGFGVFPSIVLARANGVRVRSLVGATYDSQDIREHRLLVAPTSSISDASDLRGKRIGLVAEPTSDGLALFEYLERHGIGRDEVTLHKIPHPEMVIALVTGAIDVAAAIDPFVSEALVTNRIRVLAFYYPDRITQVGTYIVHEDWLAVHRELASQFASVVRRATQWINEDKPRLLELLPNLQDTGIRFTVSKQAAEILHVPGFLTDPTRDSIEHLIDQLQRYGFIEGPLDASLVLPYPD